MDFRYARPSQPPPSPDLHQPPPQQPVPPPPGTSYSGQFHYNSPPQWAQQPPPPPPPYAAAPPPPMPPYANHYSVPPRPHMPLPPPPPQPHYPHVNQEWSNPGWGHQGYEYSAHSKNEDDWAARARAWAASKAVTDDQHQQHHHHHHHHHQQQQQQQHLQSAPVNLPEETNHQNQYTQNMDYQQHSVPPSSYQQYSSSYALPPRPPAHHLQEPLPPPPPSFSSGYGSDGYSYPARDGNLREPAAVYPRQEMTPTTLSGHQQEVPSSYSSVAGKEELSDMNRNFYQPSPMAFASAPQHQHQLQPSISPNERSIPVEQQPHYSFNNSSAESVTDLSNQPLDFGPRYGHDHGPFVQSGVPGMPYPSIPPVHTTIHQTDPSVGVSSPASLNSTPFGRISSFQPTMPPANTTFPIGTSNAFHGDSYVTPGFPDRPKKASVPNWLREEIIKKKAVIGSSAPEVSRQDTESNEDEVMDPKGDHVGGKSMDSTQSAEEEGDDEDYVEAARTAAVNQEIKRILTEVLLKVTDELFDEIATDVLEEDDLNVEVERKADNASATITPKSTAKVIIPANTKGVDVDDASGKSSLSSPGDVLGLGNYASDDDDEEDKVKNVSVPSSNSGKPPVHLSENGSSQVDGSDARGKTKKLLEESDSRRVSPNRAIESRNDMSDREKVKPDSSDFSKSTESAIQGDLKSRNGPDKSSKDKKHNKVDEKSGTHDERHVKREKQEDQNGSKERIKDQDSSGKKVKDDKEERERDKRSRDKEDSRKREKEKDEKSERTKYKSVGDSSRRKRHHSPSPGGRGRSSKDNSSVSHAHGSSDSSSDDSRRKVHSKRRDLSPSPVRSKRQVSRSPSKRSHRRHSIYSSLETTRERRRSRSRSRSRSRRG
ncbi:putative PNN-interacting serine/arginine-rich protein [Helianthus annuus]|uniref:PNN-interacting serine/arginine-rich protein n=1 Tax=Helianthus annuus TaxID=4232 RepID=A0A251U1R3_HELAN|nr:uncharacterized protein DDB_G0284459 [Helianthus annuus]KAF5793634.1 putative PNN-interacting serine/arginine-rich protein [Helianthus annuus]KAJ0537382.1 putative PNN-interacting serine/arginine-rich protein [Helianthus annuus]KAJ0551964.1 putative PNN-interacting serine/arginine-rich protein [Helianthus annuus]KAJ0717668.1 putative PNN-interacting serine/arginine-rich protein [Helianthus annuus]KAJ0720882.1 putative PNN-interacting serine/arginine-rich protein [Helianthus annuus]